MCVARNGHDLLRRCRGGVPAAGRWRWAAADEDMGADSDDAAAAAAEAGRHYASWIARAHAAVRPKGVVLAFIDDERVAPRAAGGLQIVDSAQAPHRQPAAGSQGRQALLRKARSGRVAVLVVTEMAARGMTSRRWRWWSSLRVPASSVQYLHRAGRAARRISTAAAALPPPPPSWALRATPTLPMLPTLPMPMPAAAAAAASDDAEALDSDEYADAAGRGGRAGGGAPQAQHGMVLTFVDNARPARKLTSKILASGRVCGGCDVVCCAV